MYDVCGLSGIFFFYFRFRFTLSSTLLVQISVSYLCGWALRMGVGYPFLGA